MSPVSTEAETVTLGEVNRNLIKLTEQVTNLANAVAGRPEWADLKRIETALEKRIASLESWVKWAGRTIIGALIVAAVGLLLKFG
ncbi:hypothetical protein ACFY5D_18155 [Paeniglutamicibacter sp. NPDC012692]|uniref:hypothetical protein n=1 Tax=Paeniglutamicibacter sp. NPDC012692 TaxID=3364388 RepID=UPI0036BF5E96